MPPGSAYQGLIIPPPKAAPKPFPAAQGGIGGPPILRAQAPPASSYSQQSAAGSYTPPPHATYSTAGLPPAPRKSQATGLAYQFWQSMKAKGAVPPGAKFPSLVFDSRNTGAPAYTIGKSIHMSPQFVQKLINGTGPASVWAQQGLVHEMAHTMQNKAALGDRSLAEGGAQTFADLVAPGVVKNDPKQPVGYNALGLGAQDSNYAPYVAGMLVREPSSWVSRGQFMKGASAPTINAPGTRAFAGATSRLGSFMGAIVNNAANRPALWRKYHPNG